MVSNQNINEKIISPVYTALIQHVEKTSRLYKKHLLYEQMGEEMDVREKAGIIIESFPWPIGKELSRLFSADYVKRDEKRLKKIFEIAERTTQFLSFCWLLQLWEAKKEHHDLELSPDFEVQFKSFFKPSIGIYLGVIRAASRIIFEQQLPCFFEIEKLPSNTAHTISTIEKLVVHRNNEFHFKSEISCEEAEEHLAEILRLISFLVKYPLVSVRNIHVDKPRFKEARFRHSFFLLNSKSPDFGGENVEVEDFSDSHSVLLIQNIKSIGRFLNLSPFIIDTKPFFGDRERSQVMSGLYIYMGKKGSNYLYHFVNSKEIHPLNQMPMHDDLSALWEDLAKTFDL